MIHHRVRKTGVVRKNPLIRAVDDGIYILVYSMTSAPKNPVWDYNLKADPNVESRDKTNAFDMRGREVSDPTERQRLWDFAVAAYPPY